MAYTLHAGSTPFTTPGHHSTPSSSPFNGHTPLQPRTPNVPQDPFSAPSTGQRPDPFNFSPFNPKPTLQFNPDATPAPAPPTTGQKKGYRFTAYTGRENSTAHRPLNSSPLAQGTPVRRQHNYNNNVDDMEDEEDDDAFSAHQPSSPLSRVAPWSSSTATGPSSAGTSSHSHSSSHLGFGFTVGSSSTSASSARRTIMKTPGRDDDDDLEEVEDDAVNPSPLFHRRRAQYKSTAPSLSAATRRRISSGGTSLNSRSPAMPRYASPTSSPPIAALFENPRAGAAAGEDENPRKAFLRERFKKTYFARATKAREEAVRKRRRRVEGLEGMGSDEEMEEEGDEAILNDVLFARIMASLNKKQERAYRISYAREVGSSFDPDLEDVSRWEQELSGAPLPPTSFSNHPASPHRPSPYQSTSTGNNSSGFPSNGGGSSPPRPPTEYEYGDDGEGYGHGEEDFVGLEEAEIEAYAEEYARAVEGREAEAASASGSSSGTGAHSSGTGAHSSGTGAQQGQGQGAGQGDVANLLEGLEDLPEEELFGVWNWDDGDEMDLS